MQKRQAAIEKEPPPREDNGVGFAMMWTSVKPGCDAKGEDFEKAATSAECRAVVKHENVRPRRGLALPIRGGIFLSRVHGRLSLPLAKFDIEAGQAIRNGSRHGVLEECSALPRG